MENPTDSVDVPIVLITANVGSLFEDPEHLMKSWLKEFVAKIEELQPQFLAIHMQEVGGKTYEKNLDCVRNFIHDLCTADQMNAYTANRIYLDEDLNTAENFTALGSLYFIHNELKNIKIWNFCNNEWEPVEDKATYHGDIEKIATKDKAKFPQHFFPECKWSRKGFMRTRWEINGTIIDLVNIHLFHDASNLAACETFPSVYCKNRRRALLHILERFHVDHKNGVAPIFLFGDFNFRCDTEGVINELTKNLSAHRIESLKSDVTKICYRNSLGDDVLTIGKKEFNHIDHQCKFKESWLRTYDREMEALEQLLVEYDIEFPPTYPYEENPEIPSDYMSTRCPAWCDRILMTPIAKRVTTTPNCNEDVGDPNKIYNVIGEHVCMGDHKPVYLNIRLKANQGNIATNSATKEHLEAWETVLKLEKVLEAKAHFNDMNSEAQAFQARTSFVQISTITAEELNQKQNSIVSDMDNEVEVTVDGQDDQDSAADELYDDKIEVQKSGVLKETRV